MITWCLHDCHWLMITKRIEYKLCTLVYRCLHGNAPRYLADHVALTSSVGRRSGLRSADTLTLEVPITRLLFGNRAFSVAGPRAWNSLLINVCSAQSMFSFRKLLKSCYSSVCILYLIRVLTLSGVLVAFFAYIALNLSFLHYITMSAMNGEKEVNLECPDSSAWKKTSV